MSNLENKDQVNNQEQASERSEESEENLFTEGSLPARVVSATSKLTELLQMENKLLNERRVAETKELQNEKEQLSTLYQNELRALQQNPSCLGPKNSPLRQQLKKVTDAFQEEVKKHGRILLRLKTVAEGLVHSISTEAGKKSGVVPRYDTNAVMHNVSQTEPINIALNEVI